MVCGACLTAVQPALAAEVQPGFYLGIGGGQSSYDIEKSLLDDAVVDGMASVGWIVTSLNSTYEDSDTALQLFAGYQFNPYIGVEAGYIDLGAAELRATGNVNPPGPVFSQPYAMNIDIESTGFTLAGLGRLPLGSVVDLHGRLGLLFAQTDISASSPATRGLETETLDSISGFFAVGAGVTLGQHWSLSIDWTRYDNVGDEDEDDDVTTEAGFNVDALSFSATFRF
jgi:hypothetical protein